MSTAENASAPENLSVTANEKMDGDSDEIDEATAAMIHDPDDPIFAMCFEPYDGRRSNSPPNVPLNAVTSPPKPPVRPILRRDGSAPLPPQQPPPPAPPQQDEAANSADSLSLAQLKRLVTDLPRIESTAYAYNYEDTRSFPEELNEWFQYSEEDKNMLLAAKSTFRNRWEESQSADSTSIGEYKDWIEVDISARRRFVVSQLQDITKAGLFVRVANLEALTYIVLGAWSETAGFSDPDCIPKSDGDGSKSTDDADVNVGLQRKWMRNAAHLFCQSGALAVLYELIRIRLASDSSVVLPNKDGIIFAEKSFANFRITRAHDLATEQHSPNLQIDTAASEATNLRELELILTILYVAVEVGRQDIADGRDSNIRKAIVELKPNLLNYLCQLIAKLRWDDTSNIPLTRLLLLIWKTMLLEFGSTKQLNYSKTVLRDKSEQIDDDKVEGFITASPLDYHLFRQEITSKYPAYNPPLPLVPLELENNSILPPLPNHPSRNVGHDSQLPGVGANVNGTGRSIFHQPVHIATPAPSPPPSPAGSGGKGAKKQNYQTNQNFPFLYPPLDNTSNTVGGKGNAELQDKLVGKKWEGSDVPTSILEAGQLFASRMRMSRSTRQLWEVREEFMKFERGWEEDEKQENAENFEIEKLEMEAPESEKATKSHHGDKLIAHGEPRKETENEEVQSRMDAIDDFYRYSLPHLQSIVIVLLKIVLANVTALAAQTNSQNGAAASFSFPEASSEGNLSKPKSNLNLANQLTSLTNEVHPSDEDFAVRSLDELNTTRIREITSKAIAGILLMLLKWFKLSHILKYEYLCQLLLDSNYLPLALKLFAHQDVDRAVDQKNDREDLDFFNFCKLHSKHPPSPPPLRATSSSSSSSSDSAAPPPIQRHRHSPTSNSPPPSPGSPASPPPRPEVDELGYPTTALPQTPITNYSPRFFYTTITHLRLMQKITKRKAHRALLLVQYKSSTILRKALKIPQPELRLYTLKLFKSQVPYCGRKWRQSNMRVITAIYLHCRPELRDEWLAGGDVDGVVEEAVPLEQAGRGLVHWWHLRNYRDVMEGGVGVGGNGAEGHGEEDDFFARELEKMGWGFEGGLGSEEEMAGVEDVGLGVGIEAGTEWDGGPLQLEGW